jgi:hypothetical protein
MAIKNYTESWLDEYSQYLGAINFTAGDFNSIKNAIRDYVVKQNPEGYNDWQSSSEAGLFTNAIAYLGENINYRVDLNVNDLFPSSTTRKQSLLNFTRMLSYSSKRNICANGLAKVVSISTTQDITDTSGTLLKNVTVKWNDSTNEDWLEQFLTILNNVFVYTNQFGKPIKNYSINNVSNQIYQLNSLINSKCAYPFDVKLTNGSKTFEIVNPSINTTNSTIYEMTPIPERMMHLLYRNDGAGNSSKNTGFFVYWKQGLLKSEIFNFNEKIENNVLEISSTNINNDDVWFQEISSTNGYVTKNWTKISQSEQLSYTNTDNSIRSIYKVETNENDTIKVKFSDGYFGDIPYGLYRLWYRVSNGNEGLYIKPSDIYNKSITIPYYNNTVESDNNVYYLTITFSVEDVSHIYQSVPTESLESIRENAPNIYSTQDRMVSGKDYNYYPKIIGQTLKVLKAVERTYAGNSRYIDLNDSTGTYDNVNILATDGYLYNENGCIKTSVDITTQDAETIYTRYVQDRLSLKELSNLYYYNYEGSMLPTLQDQYYFWTPTRVDGMNTMEGYLSIGVKKSDSKEETLDNIKNAIKIGDILCFQEYIDDEELVNTEQNNIVWVRVEKINKNEKDKSIITISEVLDINKKWKIRKNNNSKVEWSQYYNFNTSIDAETKNQIISRLNNKEVQSTFGLTYYPNESATSDSDINGKWVIIDECDSLKDDEVKLTTYGDESQKVLNWFFRFVYNSETGSWDIDVHQTKTIFGSIGETSFFFNTSNKDASNDGYFITEDIIKLTGFDNKLSKDYYWKPYNIIKRADGYIEPQEFCCCAYDGDKDAVVDVPTQYMDIVSTPKDIIFMTTKDEVGDVSKVYIDYTDLCSIYNETAIDINAEACRCSLWGKTLTSGYYYCYHRMKEIIGAGKISSTDKTTFYLPISSSVMLSDGNITEFNGGNIDIKEFDTKSYDFVDYIREYDQGIPLFYDDIVNGVQKHGYLYYYNASTKTLTEIDESQYTCVKGLDKLTFLWKHYATEDYVIDPCSTNIIDMFVLTNSYYSEVQEWIQNGKYGAFPKAPSAYELKGVFSSLETKKMISDTIVWHPVRYKLLFGPTADTDTHCIFKVIKRNDLISDNEVKKQVITLVDKFFKEMSVGETFYFTQLSTYIENNIPSLIKTVLIVPTDTTNKFGKLFQIKCDENEILLSSATLDDVQIISTITDQNIRAV